MSGTTYFLLLLTYFSFNLLRVSNISPLLVDDYQIFHISRWFNFEKVIEALVAENVYHTNTVHLQTYAKDVCFIEDDEQFHTMLNFYHDLGMIVKHRSTVILKAQWLINLFKKLITIPAFKKAVGKDNLLCIEMIADRRQDLLPSPNLRLTKKC